MATKIGATVSDPQIGALLGAASNAAFLMTILVARHSNFGDGADAVNKVFWDYGKQPFRCSCLCRTLRADLCERLESSFRGY
jgi:hypothetical protein